jgi:hypothetical protein
VSDRAAVGFRMVFGGFAGMVRRMKSMSVCSVCVMGGLFVVTRRMVFGGGLMVSRSMLVMFCSFSVMFRSFVVLHRNILFRGDICGGRLEADSPHGNSIEF